MTEKNWLTMQQKAMREVEQAKSWKKIGKVIELYSICSLPSHVYGGSIFEDSLRRR